MAATMELDREAMAANGGGKWVAVHTPTEREEHAREREHVREEERAGRRRFGGGGRTEGSGARRRRNSGGGPRI